MGENGNIKIPLEIFEEVKDGPNNQGKDLLFTWLQVDANRDALLLDESVIPMHVQRVVGEGYATDLTDDEVEQLGRDPFLVAYALANLATRSVVTVEVSKPKRQRQNRHVPDVCASLGVRCTDPFQMNRALDFRTNWKP
jgi:Domain of unknown function (DUF4411)